MQCTSLKSGHGPYMHESLPGCYSSRDLNVGANGGTWTICNNERTLKSGHSRCVSSVYDKEILRQTMLKHEFIFRDQVHELHRLYRKQRELMDEIRMIGLSKQNLQLQTSQSTSFLSKISSESAKRTWEIPVLPLLNPAASRLSISSAENFQSTSSFSAQTEGNLKDCKLTCADSEKPKKKMIDLELPADEYLDSEDEEKVSKVTEMPEVSQKSDLELFSCGGLLNSICQGGFSSPDPFSRRTNDLADLNEPIRFEDVASNSVNFLGSDTHHKRIPYLGRDFSKEIVSIIENGRVVDAYNKCIHPDYRQQEHLPRNEEIGQRLNSITQVSSSGKLPMPFEQLKGELLGRKIQNQGTYSVRETSERNYDLSIDDYRGLDNYCLPASYQLIPQSDLANFDPSSVSSQRKPTRNIRQIPIAVQALPCFNPVEPSSKSTHPGFVYSTNLRSNPSVGSFSPLGNSFFVGSQSESMTEACSPLISFNLENCSNPNSSPSSKAVDLNMPPSCLLDSEVSQQNDGTEDGVKKHEEPRAVLPRPREMPDYNNKTGGDREDLSRTDLVFSQAFPTSVCDAEPKRFKTSECAGNEKIPGSFNFGKPCVSTAQVVFSRPSSSNSNPVASEDRDIVDSTISGVGNQINLNCCINEDESSPALSTPRFIVKTVGEIDLEAPVSPENKESSPPRGESEESQLETPINLSKQEDSNQKDELVRMAAEAIVLISIPGYQKLLLENIVFETPKASPSDSLHWFASVVSSVADDLENKVGVVLSSKNGGDQQELSSGSDYFEAMTLKLTETKVEGYCCKNNAQKGGETRTVLSPRGRTRRGRQRKDFQAKVLPSLASLSRHEVTEDLQTIGGMMDAACFPAEASPGRRNRGRNACSRARRSGNSFFHGMENSMCSPLKQQNIEKDFAFGERRLKGWGKINRRRRGPRIPACNPLLIFSYKHISE